MPRVRRLPRLSGDAITSQELRGFARVVLRTAGVYEPGGESVVYDPLWSGAALPDAIVAHELTHQTLTINTSFGLFTQLVRKLTLRGHVAAGFERCLSVQWAVQELAATYAELAVVAERTPSALAGEIRRLPSRRLGQPPYREAFEMANGLLPLSAVTDAATLYAMDRLVLVLAYAAMSTDCLHRAAASPPTEAGVLGCMSDDPGSRLERLIAALAAADALPGLVERVRQLMVADGPSSRVAIVGLVQAAAPDAIVWGADDLQAQVQPVLAAWAEALGHSTFQQAAPDELRLKFGFGAQRARDEVPEGGWRMLEADVVARRVAVAAAAGQGLILELALRDPHLAHLHMGSYLLARPGEPWPAEDPPAAAADALAPDLSGVVAMQDVIEALRSFQTLPRIVSLLDSGWEHVTDRPDADILLQGAIGACRLTELSEETIWQALRFGRHGDRCLVLRLSDRQMLACILAASEGGTFVIARLSSEPAVRLFVGVCEALGFASVADRKGLEREINLLTMLGRF